MSRKKVKVRLLQTHGGVFCGLQSPTAGTELDVEKDYAKALIKGGMVELVAPPQTVQKGSPHVDAEKRSTKSAAAKKDEE